MSKDENKEYVKRQLELLLYFIDVFEKQEIGFSYFLNQVEALITVMSELVEKREIDRLQSIWGGLEGVYACALDQKKDYLSDEEKRLVLFFLNNLKEATLGLIARLSPSP